MYEIYFILEWHSTCFGRSFRPSSGVQDCTYSNRHLSNRYCCLLASKEPAVSVWQMPVAVCTVLNSWRWTERPSETCRVSFQNKINFIHWLHLVGFTIQIIKKSIISFSFHLGWTVLSLTFAERDPVRPCRLPDVPHARSVLLFLNWSPEYYILVIPPSYSNEQC